MELKIRIKEVKEETRPITLEEKCMFLISTDMHYSQKIRDEIRKRLDALGLLIRVDSKNIVFRVETIRDATQEEYRAWAYLQLKKHCTCTERKLSSVDCDDCFLSGACVASDFKTATAKYILKNKEVILELV